MDTPGVREDSPEFSFDILSFPDLVRNRIGDIATEELDLVYAFQSIEYLKPLVSSFRKKLVRTLTLEDNDGRCRMLVEDGGRTVRDQTFDQVQDGLEFSSLFSPQILKISNLGLSYQQFMLLFDGREISKLFVEDVTITPMPALLDLAPTLAKCKNGYDLKIKGLEIGDAEINQLTRDHDFETGIIYMHNVKATVQPTVVHNFAKAALPNQYCFLVIRFAGAVADDSQAFNEIKNQWCDVIEKDGFFECGPYKCSAGNKCLLIHVASS